MKRNRAWTRTPFRRTLKGPALRYVFQCEEKEQRTRSSDSRTHVERTLLEDHTADANRWRNCCVAREELLTDDVHSLRVKKYVFQTSSLEMINWTLVTKPRWTVMRAPHNSISENYPPAFNCAEPFLQYERNRIQGEDNCVKKILSKDETMIMWWNRNYVFIINCHNLLT